MLFDSPRKPPARKLSTFCPDEAGPRTPQRHRRAPPSNQNKIQEQG